MKCPKCKKELEYVYVISEYTQRGILKGNKIVEYEAIRHTGSIGTTIRTECPECSEDISKYPSCPY